MRAHVKFTQSSVRLGLSLLGLATLLMAWSIATRWLGQSVALAGLLGPGRTFESLYQLVVQNQLTVHTLISLKRVLVSLALALGLGVPIGLAVGTSRALHNSTSSSAGRMRRARRW